MMSQSTCILTLGLPRSGTSTLSGVVNKLGIPTGVDITTTKYNAKGYFEDSHIVPLNSQVVSGRSIDYCLKASVVSIPESLKLSYNTMFEARSRDHKIWGLKSPRVLLFYKDFLECLSKVCEIKVLLTCRPRYSVQKSLFEYDNLKMRVEWDDIVTAVGKWEQIRWNLIDYLEDNHIPVCHVSYGWLINDTVKVVNRIAKYIGVPPTQEAYDFPDFRLAHNGF